MLKFQYYLNVQLLPIAVNNADFYLTAIHFLHHFVNFCWRL